MKALPATIKPRHRLLTWARRWHTWGGLIAALFLLVVGSTGMLLNYKKPVLAFFGLEPREATHNSKVKTANQLEFVESDFSTLTGWGAAGISAGDALSIARQELGHVALDRMELKREADVLLWKIKSIHDREVIVDAGTGEAYLKGRYEKMVATGTSGKREPSTDWGKIALDLHTGKIGGEAGKAFMTAVAFVLVFLSLSGVYLYAKPLLIRRAKVRTRVTAANEVPNDPPAPTRQATASVALCEGGSRS